LGLHRRLEVLENFLISEPIRSARRNEGADGGNTPAQGDRRRSGNVEEISHAPIVITGSKEKLQVMETILRRPAPQIPAATPAGR
jgi:hypothetical protein